MQISFVILFAEVSEITEKFNLTERHLDESDSHGVKVFNINFPIYREGGTHG
jgi:hypothetical protein